MSARSNRSRKIAVRTVSLNLLELPNSYRTARGVFVSGGTAFSYEAPEAAVDEGVQTQSYTNTSDRQHGIPTLVCGDPAFAATSRRCVNGLRRAVVKPSNLRKRRPIKDAAVGRGISPADEAIHREALNPFPAKKRGQKRNDVAPASETRVTRNNRHAA